MNPSRARALVALVLAAAAVAACSWSVPADPGLLAQRRGVGAVEPLSDASTPAQGASAPAPDDGARAIYADRCSRCHEPFHPTHLSAAEWPAAVRKYGPRAGLFGAERERVLAWLQANAR